jgi:hypothetical protein
MFVGGVGGGLSTESPVVCDLAASRQNTRRALKWGRWKPQGGTCNVSEHQSSRHLLIAVDLCFVVSCRSTMYSYMYCTTHANGHQHLHIFF